MASSHTSSINNQFLDGEIVIDFAPKITSTQLVKPSTPTKSKPRRKRSSRVLQEPLSNDITNYWRSTKRNRMEPNKLKKGIKDMSEEEDGDSDFYNNDARLDIVWADDNSNRYRKNMVNLKPIEKVETENMDTNEDGISKCENMETSGVNQVEKVELVLNSLISCLRVDPANNGAKSQCYSKSQEVIKNTSFGLSSYSAPSTSNDYHEIVSSSLDEDAFDDDDWLSQIPDEALLLDEKAFVEKGDNGVVSKALLRPRENVPVPKREEVVPKPDSQSTANTITDSAMLDQENKNIPIHKERKTIPPQTIRRSILNYINKNSMEDKKKNTERTTVINKSNALGEVTNTLGTNSSKSNNHENKQVPGQAVKDSNQSESCQSQTSTVNQPVESKVPENPPCDKNNAISPNTEEDDEFEFDDDDDVLFKSVDLDPIPENQSNEVLPQPKEETNYVQKIEEVENVQMDQDSFVWEEEADDICRNIDLSIFN